MTWSADKHIRVHVQKFCTALIPPVQKLAGAFARVFSSLIWLAIRLPTSFCWEIMAISSVSICYLHYLEICGCYCYCGWLLAVATVVQLREQFIFIYTWHIEVIYSLPLWSYYCWLCCCFSTLCHTHEFPLVAHIPGSTYTTMYIFMNMCRCISK